MKGVRNEGMLQVAVPYAGDSSVAWVTPDSFVAALGDDTSLASLYLVNLTRHSQTLITGGWSVQPAVDPSGKRLAYLHKESNPQRETLIISNLDGSSQMPIARNQQAYVPAWSTDGSSVLFIRSGLGLFVYDLATGSTVQVSRRPMDSMAWAP